MRYIGSLWYLVSTSPWTGFFAPDEALPEIVPGAFAAWAQAFGGEARAFGDAVQRPGEAEPGVEPRIDGPVGAPCVTPAGRAGRIVELVESGRSIRVCVRA